ncbi:hypothetical protein V2H43_10890, partial [Pasteurella multocida]|uniref:hypothetical protein n=1 Tax=Pasteurella multocida TaxID=747 RepID=UPI002EB7F3FD|nr:hypothetical protein [Pasteurella multocida]
AAEILDDEDLHDDLINTVVLLDRMTIEETHRSKGLLPLMFVSLVSVLQLDRAGCLIVTEPEPQRDEGGCYPDGQVRDRALAGLRRSLAAAGFDPWADGRAYWRKY